MEQQLSNARTRIIELTGELQSSRVEAKRTAEEAADLRQELQDVWGTLLYKVCIVLTAVLCARPVAKAAMCHSGTCYRRPRGPCRPARVSAVHFTSTMPCSMQLCCACLVCHLTCLGDCCTVWQLLRRYERPWLGG